MLVLDTNTVIYFFKDMGGVPERLMEQPPADIAISAVTLYELETGIAKSKAPKKRRGQLDTLLSAIRVLPFDPAVARRTGELRASLEKTGTPIGPLDTLIAGTCLTHGATLVSRNVEEFEQVPGLTVVSWFQNGS